MPRRIWLVEGLKSQKGIWSVLSLATMKKKNANQDGLGVLGHDGGGKGVDVACAPLHGYEEDIGCGEGGLRGGCIVVLPGNDAVGLVGF